MPSDALHQPWDQNGDEPTPEGLDYGMPPGVQVAPTVDMDSEDPSYVAGRTRQCVALTKAGQRCSVPAIAGLVICSAHAGRLDASAGGKARAEQLRLVRDEAQNRAVNARLGTRATIAAALAEKHDEIRLAVHELADRAADGDRQAALALLPFVTQALGTPTQAAPTSVQVDGEDMDLSTLDTASLKALLTPDPPT